MNPETILVVEDDQSLNRLVRRILDRDNFVTVGVFSGAEAIDRIEGSDNSLMLLDYKLPDMTGKELIEALGEKGTEVPFIVVTGQGDEQTATDMMKLGARDYLVKDEGFIDMLPHVVRKTLKELRREEQLADAERSLIENEARFRSVLETANDAIIFINGDEKVHFWNRAAESIFGYSADEMLNEPLAGIMPERYSELHSKGIKKVIATYSPNMTGRTEELSGVRKDKSEFPLELSLASWKSKGEQFFTAIIRDISERKKALDELNDAFAQIDSLNRELIFRLTVVAEFRDTDTGAHISRIGLYSRKVAEYLDMPGEFVEHIRDACSLHDIGKIGIKDSILLKPGPLTSKEFEAMKMHTAIGEKMLRDSPHTLMQMAASVALNHHERWDGSGYPNGLRGDAIPIEGRIANICDQYDALMSKRPYKPSLSHTEVCKILTEGDGRTMPGHFDLKVLAAFKELAPAFEKIYNENHG